MYIDDVIKGYKVNILSDEEMKAIGFYDAKSYWLYSKVLTYWNKEPEFSIDIEVYKDDGHIEYCILDEEAFQPVSRFSKEKEQELYEECKKHIKYLVEQQVLVEV